MDDSARIWRKLASTCLRKEPVENLLPAYGAPVDITPYLQDVTYNLKNQYQLVFLAKSGKKPALEPVKVKTEMPKIGLITAENGYIGSGM